jgi:tRNA threonylcarbamoyladenosine biosynthesis protein TsaE
MKLDEFESLTDLDLKTFQMWARAQTSLLRPQTVILLRGPLGAGKTEFVKCLLAACGLEEVTSPTFALRSAYPLSLSQWSQDLVLDHWDLYRLEDEDDLESSGFWDQFMADDYCMLIEWPERLNLDYLPQQAKVYEIEISIATVSEGPSEGPSKGPVKEQMDEKTEERRNVRISGNSVALKLRES